MSDVQELEVPLERDVFLRQLLRELSGSLQDAVGMAEASGYISAVGEQTHNVYRQALTLDRLARQQVANLLVDPKRRIQGDFYIIEETEDKIVLGNRARPYAETVRDKLKHIIDAL